MSHSKWQDLPTEKINPDTLGIDTMPVLDIIDLISAEDRRVVSAVHKERERIAHGVDIIVSALRKGGRVFLVGAGTSGRLGILEAAEMPLTFGTPPKLVQAIMAGGQEAVFKTREGVEDNFEEGARVDRPAARVETRCGDRRVRERDHAVRPRRAHRRPQEGRAHHLRHLLARDRAPELRRPDHRAGRWPRGHRRVHTSQGGHRHQDGAQHADDDRDDSRRQDLRQPDGGRPDRVGEAQGPRLPHRRHRDRHRPG